jgi:glycosyltransferase involved in cell wall biosynthesis
MKLIVSTGNRQGNGPLEAAILCPVGSIQRTLPRSRGNGTGSSSRGRRMMRLGLPACPELISGLPSRLRELVGLSVDDRKDLRPSVPSGKPRVRERESSSRGLRSCSFEAQASSSPRRRLIAEVSHGPGAARGLEPHHGRTRPPSPLAGARAPGQVSTDTNEFPAVFPVAAARSGPGRFPSRAGPWADGPPQRRMEPKAGSPGGRWVRWDVCGGELGRESPKLTPPKISILVTAYGERAFLRQALESVTRQTANPREAELILVANAPSSFEALREVTEGSAWAERTTSVQAEDQLLGAFFARGVRACSGDIIAFLNDDDLWAPSKVSETLGAFSAVEDLVYFRHGYNLIDDSGHPVEAPGAVFSMTHAQPGSNRLFSVDEISHAWNEFSRLDPGFNDSTIAIRSRALTEALPWLEKLGASEDTFFLYAALAYGGQVGLGSARLSSYRIHHGSNSLPGLVLGRKAAEELARVVGAQISTLEMLKSLLLERHREEFLPSVDREIHYRTLLLAHQRLASSRSLFASATLGLAGRVPVTNPRLNLLLLFSGVIGVLSPRSARILYRVLRGV